MDFIEIVYNHWYGMVFGTISLFDTLEMVVNLLCSMVPWFLCMAAMANLCTNSQEIAWFKTKNTKRKTISFFMNWSFSQAARLHTIVAVEHT